MNCQDDRVGFAVTTPRAKSDIPLCVDLDGTLVRTDTLIESLFALLRDNLWQAFRIPYWLAKGVPYTKRKIQSLHSLNAGLLPYNQDVLDFVRQERSKGRRTVLVTASHQDLATKVAEHLQCFDEGHGTKNEQNLKGRTKAQFLIDRFGPRGFDYLGNSPADIPVWRNARRAFTVNGSVRRLDGRLDGQTIERLPDTSPHESATTLCARTMRVHQWVKNLLVAVPLLASHKLFNPQLALKCICAILALSCLASSTYIVNDLFDIESDRKHRTNRARPIPSGRMSPVNAILLAFFLGTLGVVLAGTISTATLALCLLYVVCTLSYSMFLKRKLLVDTLMLAGLYTLRVLIGGAATQIPISFWLLAFSIFVFFSLAVMKRVIEISSAPAGSNPSGREYLSTDVYVLTDLGITSAFVATAVFALYIHSSEVQLLYANPKVLWPLCLIILY